MHLSQAWKTTLRLLYSEPRIYAAAALISLLKLLGVILALKSTALYIPGLLLSLGGSPFLIAALYVIVEDGFHNRQRLASAIEKRARGRFYYLFIARAALAAILGGLVVTLITSMSVINLSEFVTVTGGLQFHVPSASALQSLTVLTTLVLLLPLIPLFILQFYDTAIVFDEMDVTEGLGTSLSLFAEYPDDVLGYSLARLVLTCLISFPASLLRTIAVAVILLDQVLNHTIAEYLPEASFDFFLGILIAALVLETIATAVRYTFHASFYRELRSLGKR